jgi:hypothetical protein
MKGVVFSELSRLVLQEHRKRDVQKRLLVLPIVCVGQGIGGATGELLDAAIRAEEGICVTASAAASGVDGDIDDLRAAVEQYPDPEDPGRPRLTLSEGGGTVTAQFGNGSEPPWSKGEETFAGGMLVPFDSAIRKSQLALVVYDESHMEKTAADALWNYYCLFVPRYDMDHLRTLVLLCYTGGIEPTRHFQKFNSARFIVNKEKVSRRRSWSVDKQEVRRLGAEATIPPVLFLAAGFSSSTRTGDGDLPMGNELRDRALNRLVGDFENEAVMSAAFRTYCEDRGTLLPGEEDMSESEFQRTLTLERVLQLELAEAPNPLGTTLTQFQGEVNEACNNPGEALKILGDMLSSGTRAILVTVNFDELVEHQCGDEVKTFATDEDFEDAASYVDAYLAGTEDAAPLLKLHGTLSRPDSIVATVESVAKGLPPSKTAALRALVATRTEPRSWFYVGASMRDRDILLHISSREFAEGVSEWWVAPSIDSSVERFIRDVRDPVWRDLDMEFGAEAKCITTTADIFMAELQRAIR